MFVIVLLYALLASTFIFAKNAVDYANPFFIIAFRMTLAGLLLLGYLLLFKRKSFKIHRGDWWIFSRVAFFHIYIAFLAEFWSLQYLTSSKANLIYTLTPFIAAFLSYFLLKERLSPRKWLGVAIGILGMCPIFALQNAGVDISNELLSVSVPQFVLLIAVVSASYAWFDIKKLMAKNYSLILINGFAMLAGGIGAAITYLIVKEPGVPATTNFWGFFENVAALIILSNVIFYNLYGWLLKRYTLTFLTFCGFLSPLFGVFFGWLFRGEAILWQHWVSLGMITVALFIFYREELKARVLA